MSRTFHHGERRIRARGIRQDPPDLRRVARTLIALAVAQAETDALAEDNSKNTPKSKRSTSASKSNPKASGTEDST